jgi:hypothetical protein
MCSGGGWAKGDMAGREQAQPRGSSSPTVFLDEPQTSHMTEAEG